MGAKELGLGLWVREESGMGQGGPREIVAGPEAGHTTLTWDEGFLCLCAGMVPRVLVPAELTPP